jgi:hypothetical protein
MSTQSCKGLRASFANTRGNKNPALRRDGCCFGCCPDKIRMVSSEARMLPEVFYSMPAFLSAAMRLVTLSLVNIFFTCFFTVSSLINSLPAICLLLHPRAIHFITSCSLFVSPASALVVNTAMLRFQRLNLIQYVTATTTYLWVFFIVVLKPGPLFYKSRKG